ncbi:hypothetical protein ACFL5X_02745 [Candidatus Omnitrophota bacterium]
MGTKVNHPKEGQAGYFSRDFDCAYSDCFTHVQNLINEMGVSIYYQNQAEGLITAKDFKIVFKQCSNDTEVGIYLTEISSFRTGVAVTCGNTNLARFAAKDIYTRLSQRLTPAFHAQ